jgi:hypothetical protein
VARVIPPLLRPAPRPCESCPYRRDVEPGIWARSEYEKLPPYDGPTGEQPGRLFPCHQVRTPGRIRVCAGWAAVHRANPSGHELLALRLAAAFDSMDPAELDATHDYSTPVPLFASGQQAAEHGLAGIDAPSKRAAKIIGKVLRKRPDALAKLLADRRAAETHKGETP